jgi:hypothetical protein
MYKFYKINDEVTGERSDQYFEPNEKYYIDDDGERVENETYTEQNAANYERDKQINQVMYSGDPNQKQRLFDPSDELYDYCYARCNADDGYVSIGDQQDMQYWDAVNGTTTWKDHITAVKERYPKTNA